MLSAPPACCLYSAFCRSEAGSWLAKFCIYAFPIYFYTGYNQQIFYKNRIGFYTLVECELSNFSNDSAYYTLARGRIFE